MPTLRCWRFLVPGDSCHRWHYVTQPGATFKSARGVKYRSKTPTSSIGPLTSQLQTRSCTHRPCQAKDTTTSCGRFSRSRTARSWDTSIRGLPRQAMKWKSRFVGLFSIRCHTPDLANRSPALNQSMSTVWSASFKALVRTCKEHHQHSGR